MVHVSLLRKRVNEETNNLNNDIITEALEHVRQAREPLQHDALIKLARVSHLYYIPLLWS